MSRISVTLFFLRDWWHGLKLASKLNVTLAIVAGAGLIFAGLALDRTIRPAFEGLERADVEKQIAQAQALLVSSLASTESATKDYAVWDDSYDYIATPNSAFETENLTNLGLVNLGQNAMAYVRFSGEVLHAHYVDLETQADDSTLSAAFARVVASESIREMARSRSSFADFVEINGRIHTIGVAQVVHSDGTGTPAGYVVVALEFTGASATEALQNASRVTNEIAPGSMESTRDVWRVIVPIAASGGAPAGSLAFEVPRDISKLGSTTILSALLTSALVLVGTLFVVFFIMRFVVVKRLAGIDGHMRKVAKDGELAPLRDDPCQDELGALSRSFNDMLTELKELREQLEVQSFQLGQSESAASAMHNVRNSLNPVTVILSQTLSEQSPASVQDVSRAISELAAGEAALSRRERLATFLLAAFEEGERRASTRRGALQTAKASLGEAIDILRSQSETGHREIPMDRFDILDVIQKNAALARFAPWGEVVVDLPKRGTMVLSNRLLISQVIGNLLTNAVESIVAADRRPGRLTITLVSAESVSGQTTTITISDDGQGFAAEMVATLFQRGHSSKQSRASGLGLHWCANTVNALGGALTLESDGPGKGARAIILLNEAKSETIGKPLAEARAA